MFRACGICVGASTISAVQVVRSGEAGTPVRIEAALVRAHEGDPRGGLLDVLSGFDLSAVNRMAATGRKFRHFIDLPTIAEPEAVERAYAHIRPVHFDGQAVVISAGGETFMAYGIDGAGRITQVYAGNKCAAGTGEFFLQQLRRLDATLEQAEQWSTDVTPYPVSGRCSVFCKSDCTHATNKGVDKARVAAGLGQMMARKILDLLKKVDCRHVILTGGTARNAMMVSHLRKDLPELVIPPQANCFEALGAALWSLDRPPHRVPAADRLFKSRRKSFKTLPPLADHESLVEFKSMSRDTIRTGDTCLLGLDVGSTTTKAVLLRRADHTLLASIYLRTNGDPIGASRQCYDTLLKEVTAQVDPQDIEIVGLGICGSGRHIAGLHAQTSGVINEITAHAKAAVHFDAGVDTIFEIGGQDAKYTYITNGVPSDYAMNEACSAGTGSFLEESAWETMGIRMDAIAGVAVEGSTPPNFNDQCAAFIASDIKNAVHEGVGREDIVAGLVYSVCMNYSNRVKGNRPVGDKVFMQGGVCYNRAVPLAMAALTGKSIIVPPEPGLMGAFGAALEVDQRLLEGLLPPERFDLRTLARRTVTYKKSFVCRGGREGCDRRCEIARIRVDGKTFPFGGACNRYENLRSRRSVRSDGLNLIRERQRLVFETHVPSPSQKQDGRPRVGINRSFMINTYYPFYANFFDALGLNPVLPDRPDPRGIEQRNAPFCYPVELAHGFFHDLLHGDPPPDHIFLPHFRSMPTLNGERFAQLCPLVQGEAFYLQATFRRPLDRLRAGGGRVLTPLLDLAKGLSAAAAPLTAMARQLGIDGQRAEAAFVAARDRMEACQREMLALGRKALAELDDDPQKIGIVLCARPYNGYAEEAHMGIPHKFASRGIMVIPIDFIDFGDQPTEHTMYWAMGQRILLAARLISGHPQLYGTYITNFSCGPDSFIINYFREQMGSKPSLTLELDSHTADAGIETRIDAFLDIVAAHRRRRPARPTGLRDGGFQPARTVTTEKGILLQTSRGELLPINHKRVTLVLPSMGALGSEALAAAFRGEGIRCRALPPGDEAVLKLGRGHTSCKECLPLILTTGALIDYVRRHKRPDEVTAYFMPNGSGPCRFGQYHIFMANLIRNMQIPDVAVFSLSSDLGYEGLPARIHRRAWQAVVISDVFEDMRALLLADAREPDAAMEVFGGAYRSVLGALEKARWPQIENALRSAAAELARIGLKKPVDQVPKVTIAGEIFVRRDGISRQWLTEDLATRGIAGVCSPVAEWLLYVDFLENRGYAEQKRKGVGPRIKARLKQHFLARDERRIKACLAASGLVDAAPLDIGSIVDTARPHISPYLCGEAVLTVGSVLREVGAHTCGAIAIGPFGCMPNRLSEAILTEAMHQDSHGRSNGTRPFLAIESDGNPFPQLIQAKLEAFCLQATRLHRHMQDRGRGH